MPALFQSLMWSADPIIINNDDIRDYFEDKDNIGGNCYHSNSYGYDYSAIQLMFNMLVIQLVLKPIQILQYYIGGGGDKCKKNIMMGVLMRKSLLLQDGNGYIDRRELALMMRFLGEPVTQEEIDVSDHHS